MKIVQELPPNIEKIKEVLQFVDTDNVLFCYGDTIYNPGGIKIPAFLIAHEEEHSKRQSANVEAWWDRYLVDKEFRYFEELYGHGAEMLHRLNGVNDRNEQTRILYQTASRLTAPLYGSLGNHRDAMKHLQEYATTKLMEQFK